MLSTTDANLKQKKPWTAIGIFGRLVAAGFAAMFLLVALCTLLPTVYFCVGANRTKDWPSTDGIVVHSQVKQDEDSGNYDADVCYVFEVDGVSHRGTTIGYGWTTTSDRERAEEKTVPYIVGSAVLVHYDAGDPSNCVLETGLYDAAATGILGGCAGICAFLGLPCAWLALRRRGYIEPQIVYGPLNTESTPAASVPTPLATNALESANVPAAEAVDPYWENQEAKANHVSSDGKDSSSAFGLEQQGLDKGVLGGIAMMGIAVVWFCGGWACGIIFFYPPILFLIGLVGLVKGMLTGNVNGQQASY